MYTYEKLKSYMKLFHLGTISRDRIIIEIALWQRSNNFDIKEQTK